MSQSQKGFTLIELVFVIVILGILAAFAIPRYVDVQSEARAAALNGLRGAVLSSASLVYALAVAQEKDDDATETVTAEGQSVTTAFGYPRSNAAAGGIVAALASTEGFTIDATTTAGTIIFQKTGAPTLATCSFSYTEPAAANTRPTIVAVNSAGC